MTTHTFKEAVKFEGEERIAEIRARLGRYASEDILAMMRYANSYDGSFDFVEVYDLEEVCNNFSTEQAIRAMFYGDVHTLDHWFRFNGYENLVSVTEDDLMDEAWDYVDELVDWLFESVEWGGCGLYHDEFELFSAWEAIEMGDWED